MQKLDASTAFVLFSPKRIIDVCSLRAQFFKKPALERGYQHWKKASFLRMGGRNTADDDLIPDAHAGASAIVTFLELGDLDPDSTMLAENVARWTITNLRDKQGFFYYQKRKFYNVKKPYMRWSQAWMLYGLARLLEEGN